MELKDLMLLKKDVRTYFYTKGEMGKSAIQNIRVFFINKYSADYSLIDTPEALCLITDYIFDGGNIDMENLHEIESFMTDEMIVGLEDILKPVMVLN